MVKNLPAVERSTKIRFGKNVPEATDQAENTIVFNASNVSFDVSNPGAVYLSPIRLREDYDDPQIVLLMYNKETKEITESGEAATDIIQPSLESATRFGNVITVNTVEFNNAFTSFVTASNVGIVNTFAAHTLSVGSNLYIDDTGSNVLVVSGNVSVLRDMVIDGNLRVNGDTTVIYTENTSVKDAFIELGRDNTSGDTTLDLGVLMHRPAALSNVVVGYREGTDEFAIAYTEAKPTDKTFVPKTDEDINVHVYGLTHVDANIYAHEDVLVSGNVYVSQNVSVTEELTVSGNVYADKDLEVIGKTYVDGNVVAYKDLFVSGNVYVSQNVSVTEELTVSGNVYADKDLEVIGNTYVDGNVVAYKDLLVTGNVYVSQNVSVTEELTVSGNVYADKDLEVIGNTYVDGNVVAHEDLVVDGNVYVSQNVSVTEELTISGNVYADKDLEVVGNTYVDGNVVAYKDLLVTGNVYVSQNVSVIEELTVSGNVYADKDLEVIGNTYVDGNVVAYKDLLVSGNVYVSGNVNVTKQLSVSGNTYVSGNVEVTKALIVSANTHLKGDNVFVTHTMDFLDPKTAIVTDQVSNVQIRLGQLENVSNTASNPLAEEVLRYDGNQWMNAFPNHSFLTIKNAEPTATLVSGNAVYISGYQNQNLALVKLARADSPLTMPAIGIVYGDDIPPDEEGLAAAYGKVNQMNTNGYQVGETLYVSNLYAGWISNVKPYYTDGTPNLIQNVGVVTRKDTNSGAMFVTGIGRANDIPNAQLITDYNEMNYVYVNDVNNDFKKIASQNLNIPLTTAVSSSSNSAANAVTLRGVSITSGDGFHGDLVVAGNVTVDTNTFHVDAETNRVGLGTTTPGYLLDVRGAANVGTFTTTTGTVTDATHSTSKDTGVLVVTRGGLGVEANIHSTNVFAASHIAVGTSATSNTFDVRGTANVGALVATSTHISDATESTSTTTGALKVTGGVGIQKDLYARDGHFSTDVSVGSLTNKKIPYANASKILTDSQISQEADGTVVISNDVEITGSLLVSGESFEVSSGQLVVQDRIIDIANNNPDHDLDIGILMEHPGHNIGLIHHPEDYFVMGYTQNGYSDTHILRDYSNEFTLNVWGYVVTQNTVTIEHNDLYVKDGLIGVNTDSPLADLHVVGNAFVTSNITTSSNVLITGDAAATSKTTGALQVTGGVGVQGDIYSTNVTGSETLKGATLTGTNLYGTLSGSNTASVTTLTASDTTVADSTTTGALTVAGGISTQDNVYVGRNVFITSNLNVDGSTLHVDSITSNVGIGKTDPGFTLDVAGDINFSGSFYQSGSSFISTPWTIDGNDLEYTSGNIGIGTDAANATLHVGGNIYSSSNISAYEIEVANVTTTNLTMNTVTVSATLSLDNAVTVSNITSNTVQFTNSNVGVVATGNVHANYFKGDGSELTGIATTLQSVSDFGNTSSNVIQFTNSNVSLVTTS